MKHYISPPFGPRALAGAGLSLLLLAAANGVAQTSAPATAAPVTTAATPAVSVPVARASNFIGTDVLSADNRKVGDIADFAFDTARPPRLAFVLVSTGGVLNVGGTIRAVPAEALKTNGDRARIDLTRDQFMALPKVPGDREGYLSDPQNIAAIDQQFRVNAPPATEAHNMILYSVLRRHDAYSEEHGQIGNIDDVWISPNHDRAPFIEITPTMDPFQLPGKERFALPMARLVNPRDRDERFTFNISPAELAQAGSVEDTPGVQVVNDGFIGNQVLRVTVPAPGAGQPTGYSSAQTTGSATRAATRAARNIRSAFDKDPALRQANIQVSPQGGSVVISGTVSSDTLRTQAEQRATKAAKGVALQNNLAVRTQ